MVDKIADFFFERIKLFKDRNWDKDLFEEMLYWYAFKGLLFAVKDKDSKIVGAAVVRLIDSKDEYAIDEHYNHNPDGDTYFVEFMASDDKLAKYKMIDMAMERLGERKYVCYQKFKDCNRRVLLPSIKFKQLHQRMI
jgi:hypothetical protein